MNGLRFCSTNLNAFHRIETNLVHRGFEFADICWHEGCFLGTHLNSLRKSPKNEEPKNQMVGISVFSYLSLSLSALCFVFNIELGDCNHSSFKWICNNIYAQHTNALQSARHRSAVCPSDLTHLFL